MKSVFLMAIIAHFFLVTSCSHSGQQQMAALEKERDSLISINAQQQTLLGNMTSSMAEIASSLDTIAMHERMIILKVDEEGNPLSKRQLKTKLSMLSEIIKNQREKMEAMEKSISENQSAVARLKTIIAYLNVSLEQKEVEIQRLKREVDSKNFSISRLNLHVSNLQDTVDSVRQESEETRQQLETQKEEHENVLNEVFYIIGTKEQLIVSGVLSQSGTLFKKLKINFSTVNKSMLTKADKRSLETIRIIGKSPKMLTDAPDGSYTLTKGPSECILTIVDRERFWSANNKMLVIQVK